GKGSFGEVYKGRKKSNGQIVAIKVLDLDTDDEEIVDVQKEISVLSHIDNDYITRYHGSYLVGTKLWIVMDYAAGGSLRNWLLKSGAIEERCIAIIAREILYALIYLHKSVKIIHRDIKAANILITDNGHVKLCDFGVAGHMSTSGVRRNSFVGTPYCECVPPEIITRSQYDFKADIWSLEYHHRISNRKSAVANHDPRKAIFLIPRSRPAQLEGDFSPQIKEFIALCLTEEPDQRPSAEELLKTRFIKSCPAKGLSLIRDLVARHAQWKANNDLEQESPRE
ncbi:kinase-like protein, partial [Rhizoclosmatium globosum]